MLLYGIIYFANNKVNLMELNEVNKVEIRKYEKNDCEAITKLFYDTVHTVNAKDYSKEQLDAWATGKIDIDAWNESFIKHYTLVAVENDKIVGFGDIDGTGYLDRLYVHKDFQNQGIATALCDRLESEYNKKPIITHASITAKPFFLKRGYRVVKEQQVERFGQILTNFVMEK